MDSNWLNLFSIHYRIYLLIIAVGCITALYNLRNNNSARYIAVLLVLTFCKEVISKFLG